LDSYKAYVPLKEKKKRLASKHITALINTGVEE